ncbi:phosphotransferase enzyme family protein [Aspergillus eucalypticola CBS 122712]|uniref:Phosphotransferase enzyme family protein n=1 Tax=Aspergillus eucalypticola (strain CBS 122712 / IBT 29274) TaxID=1448314 RepID=A0A317USJ6_ASPEC|nr:phosphotransferase enzyme family protein [Aspergillus eucalypticola CBS 122712]PWY64329.1 phosphotransferase enzyme family protein [Aspergillus eucalypticola CBS 122712]
MPDCRVVSVFGVVPDNRGNDWDHLAEEYNDKLFAGWLQLLFQQSPALPSRLATQHRCGTARIADVSQFTKGAYNICCIVTFDDEFRALVRFPILGRSRFRTEKSRNEAPVMKLLSQNTALPVPGILGMGRWGCGPYLVITFIEGTLFLNPNVSDSDIQSAYRVMAQVILVLSKPIFSSIGALEEGSQMWKVAQRPLTLNMNELVRVGNLPPGIFAEGTFSTAGEYFEELARQQLSHLQYQRNDAKYIARCLSRKIAREYKKQQLGPFHLYCEDSRPSNVLFAGQDFSLTGVIYWKFTYVAPAEFTYTAPWWLLIESPEAWESDLHVFLARYTPRLHLFLNALRSCEDEMIRKGALKEYQRLSERMSESLNNGLFGSALLLGKATYRLSLLPQELDGLKMFVSSKMQQPRENHLGEHMSMGKLIDLYC